MEDTSKLGDQAWRYITELYSDETLARELLRRQDQEGLDVVLHLFGCWVAARGAPLDALALASADAHVGGLREQVIAPLRRTRHAMQSMGGSTGEHWAATRCAVRAAELAAERAELEMLCAWLATR